MRAFLGFDPGGYGAFGWAVVSGESFPLHLLARGTANHAKGACEAAIGAAGRSIAAVGIDAPLFWSPSGDRVADQTVRSAITRLGSSGGTVNSVNSLRGACLIQGIMTAMICQRELGAMVPITEAHPKALLWLLEEAISGRPPLGIGLDNLGTFVVGRKLAGASDHERDAALGAIAAFAQQSRPAGWRDLYVDEVDAMTPLHPFPSYWMPGC